ncbi:sporulation membrane protein YtaF [Caldanaerobius polysaccharolyticus]|uniref:sporulation membrane protein YtaF n=1 Tax=Caldanaerobius polysaccharolyticus TaxID=44256 RepID=UPI000479980E|nr:sporulation membrane protein YtaF [Caldanaerobius polysaccharolyticus]
MRYLAVFLFAISSNVDNLIVGVAMGVKKLKISILGNLIIAFVSFAGTYLSMALGGILTSSLSRDLSSYIGGMFLIGAGTWSLISCSRKNGQSANYSISLPSYNDYMENPEKADINQSGFIDAKESFILGLALALNNVGVGLGAGMSRFDAFLTSAFTFVLSIISFLTGFHIGKKILPKSLKKHAQYISGWIIVAMGVFQFFYK